MTRRFTWDGYDAWRSSDVDGEEAQAYADYVAAHASYEMGCCGYALGTGEAADVTFDASGDACDRVCPNPACFPDLTDEERAVPERVVQTIPDPPYHGPDGPDDDR